MKLEFETSKDGESVTITLDGKSVVVKEAPFGWEMDGRGLPENTAGKVIIEEVWNLAPQLIQAEAECEGMPWREETEDFILEQVYESFI